MSLCPNCGRLLNDDDTFCSKCGARVHTEVPPPLPSYQPQYNSSPPSYTDSQPRFAQSKSRNVEPDPLPTRGLRANVWVVLLILLVLAAVGLLAYLFIPHGPVQSVSRAQATAQTPDSIVSQVADDGNSAPAAAEPVNDGGPFIGRADNPAAGPYDNGRRAQPGTTAMSQEAAEATSAERDVPADAQPQVFKSVEQMPAFPGGDAALMKYISSHLQYPSSARESHIEGTVVVQFVVTKTGCIGEVKVARAVDSNLDREAVRVCRLLPNFVPGRHNGQPVNVWYTLPIKFKLEP